jgi:NitT/TauT family transport system substrate-binding protein/putative hydroxymethylpyrimidine transport system substrate-binding protein
MALLQRPLAAVLAQPGVASPRALEGKTVGVTGLPSDVAVVRSEVQGAGGDPDRVRFLTIGFNAVGSVLSRRVDAATGFWDVEGVALSAKRPVKIFRVDRFGAPPYPELVVAVSRRTLRERPELVDDVRAALRAGYEDTVRNPTGALRDLWRAAPGVDRAQSAIGLTQLVPTFVDGIRPVGRLDPARMRRWGAWEAQFKLVRTPPDVARAFTLDR